MKIDYRISAIELRAAICAYLEKHKGVKGYQFESMDFPDPKSISGSGIVCVATYDDAKREPCSSGRD